MIGAICLGIALLATPSAPVADAAISDANVSPRVQVERVGDGPEALLERLAAAGPDEQTAIEIRRELIERWPEDERAPGWMVDQAEALLRAVSWQGADTAVLVGVPDDAQRDEVLRLAGESFRLLNTAQGRLYEPAEDEAIEDERVYDAEVRVPFYRGRAALLLSAVSAAAARKTHATTAVESLGDLSLPEGPAEDTRLVNLALAQRILGDAAGARQVLLDVLARAEQAPAEAWLGLVAASRTPAELDDAIRRVHSAGRPFVVDGRADPLLTVLRADAISRALVDAWERTDRADDDLLRRAFAEQISLLDRDDLGIDPAQRRALAYRTISLLSDGSMPYGRLQPTVALVRGVELARAGSRAKALAMLADVAERAGAGDAAADALWESAVILMASPKDRVRAVRVLLELVRRWPEHPRHDEALSAAATTAYAAVKASAGADDAKAAFMEAVGVIDEKGGPDADRWRLEAARLLLEAADARGLDLLERISPDSSQAEAASSLYRASLAAMLDQAWSDLHDARARGDGRVVRKIAGETILPMARRAATHETADRFRLDLADALTETGVAGGMSIYRDLLKRDAPPAGLPAWRSGRDHIRLGLARSLLNAGKRADAFAEFRSLVESIDARGQRPRPEPYWHAWTLIVEMLGSESADRSATIRAHVKRLELIDLDLGGEPWLSRLTRVSDE
jgi:hypothetical protein